MQPTISALSLIGDTVARIDGCRTVDLILNCFLNRMRVVIAWVDGCGFLGAIPKGTRGVESVVFFSRKILKELILLVRE